MELASQRFDSDKTNTVLAQKNHIRASYLTARDQWVSLQPAASLQQIQNKMALRIGELLKPGTTVAIYSATGSEVNLQSLYAANDSTYTWAFPRVVGSQLEFYIPSSLAALVPGRWGILEPDPQQSRKVPIEDLAAVVVPGVAFDRRGHRLGYGKGYYDGALAEFKGQKIGVAFSVQISEEFFPTEDHDVAMDYVVTERFIIQPIYREKRTN